MVIAHHRGRFIFTKLVTFCILIMVSASIPLPAQGDSGGPDTFGYIWVDNQSPNPGVVYSWVNGVSGGTDLGLGDDLCTVNSVNLGFQFRFYGVVYQGVWICANGFISFGIPDSQHARFTNNFASGMGTDLNPEASGSGHVYVKSLTGSPRRFVVTWDRTHVYGTSDRQRFEIVLIEDPTGANGRILMQYRDVTNPPNALVGIENFGNTSHLYYQKPLKDGLAILFMPPESAQVDVLSVSSNTLAPNNVEPGMKDVPMLRLSFSTPTNSVQIAKIRVDVTGTATVPGDVSWIAIRYDRDRDGSFNPLVDDYLAVASPTGSPGQAILAFSSVLTVSAGVTERVFITFNVSATAVVGDYIGAGVLMPSYVTIESPDSVSSSGFPFNSYSSGVRTRIIDGSDTLYVTEWSAVNPPNVMQWETDVPMLSFSLAVDKGLAVVDSITFTLIGMPPRVGDVHRAKIYDDTDKNRVLRPEVDRLLDLGAFDGTKSLTLQVNLTVIEGLPKILFVAYDMAPDAVVGFSVGINIASASSITLVGTKDSVDPSNFPMQNTPSTIQMSTIPLIESRWATRLPDPNGRSHHGEYIVSANNSRNLAAIGGNNARSWLVVENDADFLYFLIDSIGDESEDVNDSASFAFDTDEGPFPTAPPDDQFGAGGPYGPFHAWYNASATMWEIEDDCNSSFDANHSQLACVMGFNKSGFSLTPHRVFEFRIPLPLLEVPLPVIPGYVIRFALLSKWSSGVHDNTTDWNATWPIIEPPTPMPRAWYGAIQLKEAPPPNNPPELNWTGEPGFVTDGLDPNNGMLNTTYTYRIQYSDSDNNSPMIGNPLVYIQDDAVDILGSPFSTVAVNATDVNYVDGKIYSLNLQLPECLRRYSYYFSAYDDLGDGTQTPVLQGPTVACPPSAPQLMNGSVAPSSGFANETAFEWSVEYRDADGDPPTETSLSIRLSDVEIANRTLDLRTWLGDPDNYTQGALFGLSSSLSTPSTNYSFVFIANDGMFQTVTAVGLGPNVTPGNPDVLVVSFSDNAPAVEDRGRPGVKMLTVHLSVTSNAVDVVSLRIDRGGTSTDSDVSKVRLYHDVDKDGVVTSPDVYLGSGSFVAGSIQFSSFSAKVYAGVAEQLMVFIDISPTAVADARVSLWILDSSYIGVSSPDTVSAFTSFQTSQLLINAAPYPIGMTVEGVPGNTVQALHLLTEQPTFGWTFADPNAGDLVQAAYNVSVYVDSTGSLLWFQNGTGTTNSASYNGPTLADGTLYGFQVQLADQRLWGLAQYNWFRLNSEPPAPVLQAPSDQQQDVDPGSVTLTWNQVQDAENDNVSYRWYFSDSPDFTGSVEGTTTNTSVIVTADVSTMYYWKVEAFDQYEWSSPSPTWSFVTRAPTGGVIGRVVSSGQAVLAILRLHTPSGTLVAETVTDIQGNFTIMDVQLGLYELRVTATDYKPRILTGLNLTIANPVQDVGDIELEPEDEPLPPVNGQTIDWGMVVIIAMLATILVLAAFYSLRRFAATWMKKEAEDVEEIEEVRKKEHPPPPPPPPPPPADMAISEGVSECHSCGAIVEKDAPVCPKCGTILL